MHAKQRYVYEFLNTIPVYVNVYFLQLKPCDWPPAHLTEPSEKFSWLTLPMNVGFAEITLIYLNRPPIVIGLMLLWWVTFGNSSYGPNWIRGKLPLFTFFLNPLLSWILPAGFGVTSAYFSHLLCFSPPTLRRNYWLHWTHRASLAPSIFALYTIVVLDLTYSLNINALVKV